MSFTIQIRVGSTWFCHAVYFNPGPAFRELVVLQGFGHDVRVI